MNELDKLSAKRRLAGILGGTRRAQALSPERRVEIAMLGVQARLEKGQKSTASQVLAPVATGPIVEAGGPDPLDGTGVPCLPTYQEIRIRPWSGPAT